MLHGEGIRVGLRAHWLPTERHPRRLWEHRALSEWVRPGRLRLQEARRLRGQERLERRLLLRLLLHAKGVRAHRHRRLLRHEEPCWLRLHLHLHLHLRLLTKRLRSQHRSSHHRLLERILHRLLLEVRRRRTCMPVNNEIRFRRLVIAHLFVCGLNIVCCSPSIALKKSIMAFCPGVLGAVSAVLDELASGGCGVEDAERVCQRP